MAPFCPLFPRVRPFPIVLTVFGVLFSVASVAPPAKAQSSGKRLANQDIISMASLGLSDDVIIAKIRSVSGSDGRNFDTSVDGLKALNDAKVSEAMITAMINPTPPPTVVVNAAPMTEDPNLPPPEVAIIHLTATIRHRSPRSSRTAL